MVKSTRNTGKTTLLKIDDLLNAKLGPMQKRTWRRNKKVSQSLHTQNATKTQGEQSLNKVIL